MPDATAAEAPAEFRRLLIDMELNAKRSKP